MKILVSSILDMKRSAPSRLHHILRRLGSRNEVTVISPFDSWKLRSENTDAYRGNFSDIERYVTQEYLPLKDFRPAIQDLSSMIINRRIRELVEGIDIHLNYNSIMTGLNVSRVATSKGVNTVLDLADDIPAMVRESEQFPRLFRKQCSRVAARLLRMNIDSATSVCCSSRVLSISSEIPREKSRIIPNGVDTNDFREVIPFEETIRTGPTLIYIGVVREWVDLDSAAEATRKLCRDFETARLLVVGGNRRTENSLNRSLHTGHNVENVGSVSHDMVPEFINRATIGLIPFKRGRTANASFPLKALEYASCGRPVITSSIGELMTIFGESFYYADNATEIANCAKEILMNPSETRKRVNTAMKIVAEEFDWNLVTRRYEQELISAAG